MQKTIYIADDEKEIREIIQDFLIKEGYLVECFETGDNLVAAFAQKACDLVILDIMMPGTDGIGICTQLRHSSTVPIIMVSAKGSPVERVMGLTVGSDDYLAKPFLPMELVARVNSLLRRIDMEKNAQEQETFILSGLQLSLALRTAFANGQAISLTPTEFDFLAYLGKNAHRAVSREELLGAIWQFPSGQPDTRAPDDLVKRLRKKLRDAKCGVYIETVWGFGFRISEKELAQ